MHPLSSNAIVDPSGGLSDGAGSAQSDHTVVWERVGRGMWRGDPPPEVNGLSEGSMSKSPGGIHGGYGRVLIRKA